MKRISSIRTTILLPLALLSAAVAVPASANWFSTDPATGIRRHIGSAPNPTPADIRESRTIRENEPAKERSSAESKVSEQVEKTR